MKLNRKYNEELLNMQEELAALLKELIVKYTGKLCSSVKEDTAIKLLNSILYSIDAYENYNQNKNSLIKADISLKEKYDSGLEIIKINLEESKMLFDEIKASKLEIPLAAYNDTIDDGLPQFFKYYDILFAAQDNIITIDYPLLFDDMSLTGIFRIKQYLEKLNIETSFCNLFDGSTIRKILSYYGKKYHIDYKNTPFNVFEIIINQCIFSVLTGKFSNALTISKLQFENINKKLSGKNKEQIIQIIDNAFVNLINLLDIKDLNLIDYINKYKPNFESRFQNIFESGYLKNMVILSDEDTNEKKIVFKEGKRLSDEQFSKLVDEIMGCGNVEDKINIISSNIHSLEDYLDLLDSYCLFDDEYTEVFKKLGNMELAALGKTVFYDDLRCSSFSLAQDNLIKYRKAAETEWQEYYIDFISSLSDKKRNSIEQLINKIEMGKDFE